VFGCLPLLNVSKGQLPNDTALEKQSKLTIEAALQNFGEQVLKVVFADGDSFGVSRSAGERNWKPFDAVDVKLVEYPDESDAGPFLVPGNIPIEGWPAYYRRDSESRLTLAAVQRRPAKYEGDRHAIVVDPANRMLYEFFTFGKTADGWAAGQSSIFDLKTNELRPDGWTSADAAGLPIFPAVVRYDELERGIIEHAMRVTVRRSRRAYVHPATHFASQLNDENLPRMGERLRLRADFDISEFSPPVQAILTGLKRYGMLVADNGIDWAISVAPDLRIPVLHEELRKIKGADFEVVVAPK